MTKVLNNGAEEFDAETGELINKVEQVEVEIVEDSLPAIVVNGGTHIKTNTEQLKKELVIHLKQFDIEVTEETEKSASKMATELNKLAKDLNSKRLAVGKEIKKPADDLKSSIDELIDIVQQKRTSILEGVEVFKQKRFDTIRKLLELERDNLFIEMKVSAEYQFLDIEPLVKETSLGKSNLTKSAKESLESMVRGIKAVEDAVKIRTLELKVTCIDAGLEYPIELHEVESFIKESDYDERLSVMIESRLKVEKQVKEKAEREAEEKRLMFEREEQRKKEEAERVEREKQEEIEREEQRKKEEAERVERETGKKTITVVATFEVEVSADIDELKVFDAYEKKLKEAGFTTLKSVTPF